MGTRLEDFLEQEGGRLSHRELKIIKTRKEKLNGRESSTEGSDIVQKPRKRRQERIRTREEQQAVYQPEGKQQWT